MAFLTFELPALLEDLSCEEKSYKFPPDSAAARARFRTVLECSNSGCRQAVADPFRSIRRLRRYPDGKCYQQHRSIHSVHTGRASGFAVAQGQRAGCYRQYPFRGYRHRRSNRSYRRNLLREHQCDWWCVRQQSSHCGDLHRERHRCQSRLAPGHLHCGKQHLPGYPGTYAQRRLDTVHCSRCRLIRRRLVQPVTEFLYFSRQRHCTV